MFYLYGKHICNCKWELIGTFTKVNAEKFMDENERKLEVLNRRKELEEKWDVNQSVSQYKQLIEFLLNKTP